MAYTDADLATLRAKIASGVQSVTYADGRRVQYHSLEEMLAAEKVIEAQLKMTAAAMSGTVRRRFTPYYKSGL